MALLVLTGSQAARETDRLALPLLRQTVHVWAARVGQAEEAPDLVEGFARSVVQGAAQLDDVRRDIADFEDVGVATGDDEPDKVLGQRPVSELIDGEVADHVVDAVQGLTQRRGQRLGRADTDGQRTNETRSGRNRNRVHVRQCHSGLVESSIQGGQEGLQVRTRRDLRDDAAVAGVLIHRRGRAVDQQLRTAHEADAGLVAG